MARQSPIMSLAFEARQKLDLPVTNNVERLPAYLLEQERVVGAMLDAKKLTLLGPGSFRYNVTSFKVFQLEVNPVVSIAAINTPGTLRMHAIDSELDGLGLDDDFELICFMKNVAIFGVPRSGTSWLGQIFNSSPMVAYRFQPLFSYCSHFPKLICKLQNYQNKLHYLYHILLYNIFLLDSSTKLSKALPSILEFLASSINCSKLNL